MTPIDKIKEGILSNDMEQVIQGFRLLTGEEIRPEGRKPERPEEPRPEEPELSEPPTEKELKAHKKWEKKSKKWDKREKEAEDAYLEWMRTAYDGALSTQELLEDSRMDTSKPTRTIQSTKEVDDKVENDLLNKSNDKNLSDDDRAYYKKQYETFKKNREYHDTYVVGVDKNGRTFIVSVSNKKDSYLRDPQNNTTPSQRFNVIKDDYPPEIVDDVTNTIKESTDLVNNVARTTTQDASKTEVDDDFITVLEVAGPKYVGKMEARGTKRKRSNLISLIKKQIAEGRLTLNINL